MSVDSRGFPQMKTNHRRVSVPPGNENSQSPTGGLLPGQELAANFSYRPPQRTTAAVRTATVLCSVCAATILPQISAKIYGLGTTSVSESAAHSCLQGTTCHFTHVAFVPLTPGTIVALERILRNYRERDKVFWDYWVRCAGELPHRRDGV